ncbi:MAG: phosphoribosylglycinamide formyltransferase [Thermoguttaceae bacterium]|nr:phosphoribosylglycinamide formyltransferase [Thermoguttaceae bacterium]MBQ2684631.1 phosphoribosylglycinamide formyltransferase [Thermoguttaceae bacterium]MBQ3453597.1 phosphoribosylglycinamide formyltransferase [Thermoguttaceae bacterium]MBQ6619375.1 phosphoribosylglycinamide formyltransferase [Thermoguttaceae bacterium]MBR2584160.1 phosphoribosylglycinamide formyltransferase [Thermoguttaceae bacterium]
MSTSAKKPLPIAVLISGTGRSLKNLIEKIRAGELDAEIRLVIASTSRAFGLQYAEMANIPIKVIERSSFDTDEAFSREVFQHCTEMKVRYVIMAGYLRLLTIPEEYEGRVVNIHPSLIPSFCGKGMYGHRVHEEALRYGVKVSGCTVHFVNNDYDDGPVILQKVVPVFSSDTPQTLNDRVFYDAECVAYPEAIQLLAEERVHLNGRKVIIDEQ